MSVYYVAEIYFESHILLSRGTLEIYSSRMIKIVTSSVVLLFN